MSPLAMYEGSCFSTFSLPLGTICQFYCASLTGISCGFNLYFFQWLMMLTSFHVLFVFFDELSIQIFHPFFLFFSQVILLLRSKTSLYVSYRIAYQMCDLQIFSPISLWVVCSLSQWCPLILKSFQFWWSPMYQILKFRDLAFGVVCKKFLLSPIH